MFSFNLKTRQGKPYDDNLCLFRCLATRYYLRKKLQKQTRLDFEKWMKYLKEHDHVVGYDDNMPTFRDFLVWYNNLDVGPFVTAVENLQR